MVEIKKVLPKPVRAKFPLLMEYIGKKKTALGTIAYFLDQETAIVIVASTYHPDVMDDIPNTDLDLSDWRVLLPTEKVVLRNK